MSFRQAIKRIARMVRRLPGLSSRRKLVQLIAATFYFSVTVIAIPNAGAKPGSNTFDLLLAGLMLGFVAVIHFRRRLPIIAHPNWMVRGGGWFGVSLAWALALGVATDIAGLEPPPNSARSVQRSESRPAKEPRKSAPPVWTTVPSTSTPQASPSTTALPTATMSQAPARTRTTAPTVAEPTVPPPTVLPTTPPPAAADASAAAAVPPAVPPAGEPRVIISRINYDGEVYRVESDEFAEIKNDGTAPVDLAGWRLDADDGEVFTFPPFVLAPGASCRVYTDEVHPESGGFSFGNGKAVWNNDGDCGHLSNASGEMVTEKCY